MADGARVVKQRSLSKKTRVLLLSSISLMRSIALLRSPAVDTPFSI
jgi:hypothetical protein